MTQDSGIPTADVRLSAVVMTHPGRRHAALELQRRHPELALRVVLDPDPSGNPSALRTARVAWSAVEEGATHHLVLQDDVELCPGFAGHLRSAIAARPAAALSLFAEHGLQTASVCRIAALLGSPLAEVADSYVPTQGLVVEADVARGYDAYCRRLPEDDTSDDAPMLWYLRKRGVPSFVTVPNLLEHADVPSLMAHSGRRASVCFAGTDPNAFGWDWSLAATTPRMVPFMHWRTGRPLCLFGRVPGRDLGRLPGRDDWLRIATDQLLARRGLPGAEQDAEVGRALAAADMGAVAEVGPDWVRALWLTAFATGVAAVDLRDAHGAPPVEPALSTPLARTSLSTLARGTLWRWVPERVLGPALPVLDAMVETGAARGAAWAAGTTVGTR